MPHVYHPARLTRAAALCLALTGAALAATTPHTVQAGDTLYRIAKGRQLTVDGLLAVNPGLDPARALQVGQVLQVPVVTRARSAPATPVVRAAGFGAAWLTPLSGVITTWFGGAVSGHAGVDIAAPTGQPVRASRGGTVREARYDARTGWGWTVVLDHGDGFTSRYSHNSALLVQVGDQVRLGQVIARVGSTGNSTGPHLDYRVYQNGVAVNPLQLPN